MPSSDRLQLLWQHVSEHLRQNVGPDAFTRWFSSATLLGASDEGVKVGVPDSIHHLWIEENYLPALRKAFALVVGEAPPLSISVADGMPPGAPQPPQSGHQAESTDPAETGRDGEPDPAPVAGLSADRNFGSFVVGASNQFAHAAAHAVAAAPGRAYNPLFFYGGSGLGKTHLMQAIGWQIAAARPKARVLYITSEEFTNLFIQALQTNTIVKFRKRFRQADVLLIDDIHFLAGKERSQEEFFHTFNALLDGHKQIVLSSDRPPGEIKDLESRLVTRFEWGQTAELTPPDEETRVAILRKKAEALSIDVPPDLIHWLASRVRSNVRRLHGAFIRMASWISLNGPLSLSQAEELLRDLLRQEAENCITIDRIQRLTAESFDIRLADMVSRKRTAAIAFARQAAMHLARELTGLSYHEIGEAFGGRDHGTVMHACRTVEKRLRDDESLRLRITALETGLRRSI